MSVRESGRVIDRRRARPCDGLEMWLPVATPNEASTMPTVHCSRAGLLYCRWGLHYCDNQGGRLIQSLLLVLMSYLFASVSRETASKRVRPALGPALVCWATRFPSAAKNGEGGEGSARFSIWHQFWKDNLRITDTAAAAVRGCFQKIKKRISAGRLLDRMPYRWRSDNK